MFEHDFAPEIFTYGPLTLRWYGVLFVLGLLFAYLILRVMFKQKKFKMEHLEMLVIYLFFGLVIGARLGEIVFYDWGYYSSNPAEMLKIWKGGLSSHGATIGLFASYLAFINRYKLKFFKYADLMVVVFPLVAGFVRLGNFMNSEIVGVKSGSDFGVIFKQLGEDFARHPVQLYSAGMNFLIFGILLYLYKTNYKKSPVGFFVFTYIGLYFAGRFVVEYWKDLHGLHPSFPISIGQLLSVVPILIAVIYFAFFFPKLKKHI